MGYQLGDPSTCITHPDSRSPYPNQYPCGRTGKGVVSGFLDSFRVWGQLLFVLQRKKIFLFQTIGGQ
jgi:hypothetical protein